MKISKTSNVTPRSTPPSRADSPGGPQTGDKQYVWSVLVPRLVHPTKLAIIKALIEADRPLSVDELLLLLPSVDDNRELVKYHTTSMVEAGTLEVAATEVKAVDEVPLFFFPPPE
jgi:hypothetical protein